MPRPQGPESFVFNADGSFYTGLADGRIVQVWAPAATPGAKAVPPRYEVVARTGAEVAGCGSLELEPVCGRPLGMRRLPSKGKVNDGGWLGREGGGVLKRVCFYVALSFCWS